MVYRRVKGIILNIKRGLNYSKPKYILYNLSKIE